MENNNFKCEKCNYETYNLNNYNFLKHDTCIIKMERKEQEKKEAKKTFRFRNDFEKIEGLETISIQSSKTSCSFSIF